MFNRAGMKKHLGALLGDRQGNFAIITALTLPLLVGVAGAGLEVTRALQVKSDLQNAADAATLAAATKFRESEGKKSDEELKIEVARFLSASEFAQELSDADKKILDPDLGANAVSDVEKKAAGVEIGTVASRFKTDKGTGFKVSTTINYQMPLNPMLSLIGAKAIRLSATSTSESSFNNGSPMSMYLVLDRSGSMSFKTDTIDKSRWSCQNYTADYWKYYPNLPATYPCYVNKSTSLKTAVSFLVTTLNTSDPSYKAGSSPESTLVRTAAIAYNDASFNAQQMSWGTTRANTYVQAIPQFPQGGTNANSALTTAYNALKSDNGKIETTAEGREHAAKGNAFYNRYIVLMTDGEMTGNSSNWNASIDGQVRATCTRAKADGINIFTIAFMAPDKGKSLLQACATSLDNYYAPENLEEIVAAFGDIAKKAAGNASRLTN